MHDHIKTIRGVAVPSVGIGTWRVSNDDAPGVIRTALEVGYRHIDTARGYENERGVGQGVRDSGLPREQVFVTTKVRREDARPDDVRRSVTQSRNDLGLEYIDLVLLHWPNPDVPVEQTIEALNALREEGQTREFGVSNFPPGLLRRALAAGPVFANQVEYHPLLGQNELLKLAADNDMALTAYAPLANGRVLDEPALVEIGRRHGKTAGQVALRWLLDQQNVLVIPKSSSRKHQEENLAVFDFALSDDERAQIDRLDKSQRFYNPPSAPDWSA